MGVAQKRTSSSTPQHRHNGLTIGDVKCEVGAWRVPTKADPNARRLDENLNWRVPSGASFAVGGREVVESDPVLLSHLRWMLQKDALGQDMFLLGPPGPWRRRLLMMFAELSGREVEYVCVTRDTTESDLKQRREIISGENGKNAVFVDQAPVRAAINGRLLILDGIEKAERNVLPTLNNLLENREMQLEDGKFLMAHDRYDELAESGSMKSEHLVRTHQDFRVAALALPVPAYKGKSLDPPLRSRFQARRIDPPSASTQWIVLKNIAPSLSEDVIRGGINLMEGLHMIEANSRDAKIPHFPDMALAPWASTLETFPLESPGVLLARSYPHIMPSKWGMPLSTDQEQHRSTARVVLSETPFALPEGDVSPVRPSAYELESVSATERSGVGEFVFVAAESGSRVSHLGPIGSNLSASNRSETISDAGYYETDGLKSLTAAMAQEHIAGRDICLVGNVGCGKSELVRRFARKLGYGIETMSLYKDMTARDLLQSRSTDEEGTTNWVDSPLLRAAKMGSIAVLDGCHRLHGETLAVVERLLTDRQLDLYDGSRMVPALMSGSNRTETDSVLHVHPSFRVILLGIPPNAKSKWISEELLSMASFHYLPSLSPAEHSKLASHCFPRAPSSAVECITAFAKSLEAKDKSAEGRASFAQADSRTIDTVASSLGLRPLSTRQIARILRRMNAFPENADNDIRERIKSALMVHFLPSAQRDAADAMLDGAGARIVENKELRDVAIDVKIEDDERILQIGNVVYTGPAETEFPELIPSPLFFDIPAHSQVLRGMLADIVAGETNLLLIGNQGVGKNKLADRLLELMGTEREYMQLHRDSTVGSLTLSPSLEDGVVVWEDSALVRAVSNGRVLLLDEADKAPRK